MSRLRRPGPSVRAHVREVASGEVRDHEDRLATEEPLEIRLAWPGRPAERLSVTMRTPGNDFELSAGFLASEGIIGDASDLRTVGYCVERALAPEQKLNVVTVELAVPPRRAPSARYDGPGAAVSACGVCGKQSIDEVMAIGRGTDIAERWRDLRVPSDVLLRIPQTLRSAQRVFQTTGGIHAAGLFQSDGTAVVVREDVGRHNALDKVVGSRLLSGTTSHVPVLCVSGRLGFELVQKAIAAGVGVIAAVGAPSSLAVTLAAEAGLCAVGFLREDRFVVYSVRDRISV